MNGPLARRWAAVALPGIAPAQKEVMEIEYFLELFGDFSVGWAAVVIAAVLFLIGCYKKVEQYFSQKAVRKKTEEDHDKEISGQVEKYPQWHQQSIDIQHRYDELFAELGEKLDSLHEMFADLKKEISEDRATTSRYRILRFDDEIRHDEHHTKEHFDQILDDITEYEKYCDGHPDYRNNKAVMAIENIKRVYQKCTNEGTFL